MRLHATSACALFLCVFTCYAPAQARVPAPCDTPASPGSHGTHSGGSDIGSQDSHHGGPPPFARHGDGPTSAMRGGLQLGPPGRWWDDEQFATELTLRPDQRKRMDAIFEANRTSIVSAFDSLKREEGVMEGLTHAQVLKESDLFSQIDRVAQSHAAVERAVTHMLILIRKEMTPDQLARLDTHR